MNKIFSIAVLSILFFSCQRNEFIKGSFTQKKILNDVVLDSNLNTKHFSKFYFHHKNQPLITDFKFEKSSENIVKISEVFDGRILFLRSGEIFLFDGTTEENLGADYFINDFALSEDKRTIYVCGLNHIGRFKSNKMTAFSHEEIIASEQILSDFDQVIQMNNRVYYLSSKKIISYSISKRKVEQIFSFPLGYNKVNAFKLNSKLYVNVYPKGILEFANNDFVDVNIKVADFDFTENKLRANEFSDYKVIDFKTYEFIRKISDDLVFLATRDSFLVFDGKYIASLSFENNTEILNAVPQDASMINDSILSLATLNKGIFLLNLNNGKILSEIGPEKAYADETISCSFWDSKNGLWISTQNALSRIHFDLDIEKLKQQNKIERKILSLYLVDSTLFIGSADGAYFSNYKENKLGDVHKIENITQPIFKFISTKRGVFAISNSGVYILKGNTSMLAAEVKIIRDFEYAPEFSSLLLGTSQGLYSLNDSTFDLEKVGKNLDLNIFSIKRGQDKKIWIGLKDRVLYANMDSSGITKRFYSIDFLRKQKQKIIIFSDTIGNVYYVQNRFYRIQNNQFELDSILDKQKFYKAIGRQFTYLKAENGDWYTLNGKSELNINSNYLNIFNSIDAVLPINDTSFVVAQNNNLYFLKVHKHFSGQNYSLIYKILSTDNEEIALNETRVSAYTEGLRFYLSTPFYYQNKGLKYQYFIDGISGNWSDWNEMNYIEIPFLPSGDYTLYFRSKNIFNQIGEVNKHTFKVVAPIYAQSWFLISIIILFVLFVAAIVYWFMQMRTAQIVQENKYLEQRIDERTNDLRRKQAELTDSINYASRIQQAILPKLEILDKCKIDFFLLNRPKNIVSGDFYWLAEKENSINIAAVDCTGHGVPGAFMSILGLTLLNQITRLNEKKKPNDILEELRADIIETLNQHGKEHEMQDGMDMALIQLNKAKDRLMFSGAYRPLYIVRNNELFEFKGQRMPIGLFIRKSNFTFQEIKVEKNDMLYIFSDGYADQTGGEKGLKFSIPRFKKLLVEISSKPLHQQKVILENEISSWQNDYQQVDDILIFGLKI